MSLDQASHEWLEDKFGDKVMFSEIMSGHTSIRVGGPADALVRPETLKEIEIIVSWAKKKNLPWMIMGRGTNLLVRDKGIRGIVIKPENIKEDIKTEDAEENKKMLTVPAFMKLSSLCRIAMELGLGGMDFALGIPGTVGGAIVMNAGTSTGDMGKVVGSITILMNTGQRLKISSEELAFSYRETRIKTLSEQTTSDFPLILEAAFLLDPKSPETIREEAKKTLALRKGQPLNFPSAGCFFRNPPGGKSAGELIDAAGLKELRSGDAMVSPNHANFIINLGKAKAADILDLAESVRKVVYKKFKINLIAEVKIVGQ